MKYKICKECNKDLPLKDFPPTGKGDGKRIECRTCYNKKRKEIKDKERECSNKNLIACQICNKRFRTISNTHLACHSITMEEYKNKFGQSCFTEDLLIEQKEKREKTIEERYTEEEIYALRVGNKERRKRIALANKIFWANLSEKEKDEKVKKMSDGQKIFYDSLSDKDRKNFERKRLNKRKKTNKIKYGIEFPQSLPETIAKVKKTKEERYGDPNYTNRDKTMQTLQERFGKFATFCPHFSLISQELFIKLEEQLPFDCLYATNGEWKNNEFQVYYKRSRTIRHLDFYVPGLNKWIEFDEYHHSYAKQIKLDKTRTKEIKKCLPDVRLLRIKEEDYIENPEKVVEECLLFILDKYLLS